MPNENIRFHRLLPPNFQPRDRTTAAPLNSYSCAGLEMDSSISCYSGTKDMVTEFPFCLYRSIQNYRPNRFFGREFF